jgi:hypothetical protein
MYNRKERLKRMKENSLSERERENSIEIERVNLIRYNKTVIDEKDLLISGFSSSSSSSSNTTSSSHIFVSSNCPIRQWLIVNESSKSQQFFWTTRICSSRENFY